VTGADGSFTVSFRPASVRTSDWRIEARFDGDWWYQQGQAHTVLSVRIPNQQTVHAPAAAARHRLRRRLSTSSPVERDRDVLARRPRPSTSTSSA